MGRGWITRKGNYVLKFNLPIGVQNMTFKSIDNNNNNNNNKNNINKYYFNF